MDHAGGLGGGGANGDGPGLDFHLAEIGQSQVAVLQGVGDLLARLENRSLIPHPHGVKKGFLIVEGAIRNSHGDAVLFAQNSREDFRLAGRQLGILQPIGGNHLGQRVVHIVVFFLGDLLLEAALGLSHRVVARVEVLLHGRRVELDYVLTLLDHLTVLGQAQDAQPGHLGRHKNGGMGALDVAARTHADDEIALPDARHRDLQFGGHPVMIGRITAAAQRQQADQGEHRLHLSGVVFAEASLRSYFSHIVFPSSCFSTAAPPP